MNIQNHAYFRGLGKYMIMYDGSAIKNISKEHNTIIDRFDIALNTMAVSFSL